MRRLTRLDPLTQLKYFNFFMYGSWSMLNPYLPLYFQNAGFQSMQIGILMSVGPLISLIANPFWGYWSDRTQNPRLILIIMLICNIATSQMYFQSNQFAIVFSLMLLFYFFQTALNPISNSLTLYAIENTPYQFGTFRLWGSLGFAVMALVSSPVIAYFGIQNLGFLYASFVVLTLFLSFGLPNQAKQTKKASFPREDFVKLMTSGLFVCFLLLSVVINIPNRMNSIFISVYISGMGGNEVLVGWSWFIAAVLEVPLFLILDKYLKLTERAMFGLMTAVCALYAMRWVLMGLAASPYQVVLIQLLHGFTFGITFYTGTQICNFLVPKSVRNTGQAIYGLCWMGLSGIVSGLLGGWVYDHLGAESMYVISAVMAAVGTAGFFIIWWHFRGKSEELDSESGNASAG